jgi:nitrite reductase (NADH) large subunit
MIEYPEEVSRNILTLFGKSIFTGGISKEDKFEVYKESLEGQYKKIIIREGKLVGFVFIGNVDSPGVYLSIMKKGLDISSNRNTVLKGSLNSSMFYPSVRGITF